jgi:hypothetical protein
VVLPADLIVRYAITPPPRVTLINAIRVHERAQWTKPYPRRTDDLHLYRRVRQILGEEA